MAVSSPISINLSFVMRLTNAPTLWSVASTSQAMRSPGEPPKAAACLMHKSAETRIPNMVGCGHGQSCVPFQARILGCNLRRGLQGESASHSERLFRDTVSAPNKRPRLAMEPGPKAQHMQLMVSANSPSEMPSALYPTRGDGRGCTAYPPWADPDAACRQMRDRHSVRRALWGSLRSRRCPCRRMPRAVARPSPRR